MTMTITKKKMASEAREANVLHEEEKLTKREREFDKNVTSKMLTF